MEDSIEMTVTINRDSNPLLFEYLTNTKAGRRRAAVFKLLAENFLFLQQQNSVQTTTVSPREVESGRMTDASILQTPEGGRQGAIDEQDVRRSLMQFVSG
ncbi:hypothetical protein LMG28614_05500 [Paraburkholderia ultramafica]|uniref:Uncharacterized protein n=1 Tax=Paraburkholderia ultramafica TaxID=1544867 RepID=A0A6S7BJJ4_9BURK|nr:hypothetical protein [Paraburkholderia ultramafica]CAB3801814.1 hypothetical protein LMG28614_05500 [Paraburkholderia ultramafica]